jgi:hypothetical protein
MCRCITALGIWKLFILVYIYLYTWNPLEVDDSTWRHIRTNGNFKKITFFSKSTMVKELCVPSATSFPNFRFKDKNLAAVSKDFLSVSKPWFISETRHPLLYVTLPALCDFT